MNTEVTKKDVKVAVNAKKSPIKKCVSPKKATSKSVAYDMGNLRKRRDGLLQKQEVLNSEIAELTAKIEYLETQYAELYRAELKHQIDKTWFVKHKMSDKQILKLLEIGSRIFDKIEDMDSDTLVKVVTDLQEKNKGDYSK